MASANDLAPEAHVPVGIKFLVRMDLQAAFHVANSERKQIFERKGEQLDFMAGLEHNLFAQHFQVQPHLRAGVVVEMTDADVLARMHVRT